MNPSVCATMLLNFHPTAFFKCGTLERCRFVPELKAQRRILRGEEVVSAEATAVILG